MAVVNVLTEGGPPELVGARLDTAAPDAVRVRGWRELLLCYGFYYAYSRARGASNGSAGEARSNAWQLVGWERDLGMYHERSLQQLEAATRAALAAVVVPLAELVGVLEPVHPVLADRAGHGLALE